MSFRTQSLCQSIRHHVLRWTVFQPCRSIFNAIPDEVVLDVDMFCTSVVFRVVRQPDGTLVVTIDDILIADIVADFSEEAVEPDLLLDGVEYGHILRFHTGEGD